VATNQFFILIGLFKNRLRAVSRKHRPFFFNDAEYPLHTYTLLAGIFRHFAA